MDKPDVTEDKLELRQAEGERKANAVPLLARLLRKIRDREEARRKEEGNKK